VVGKTLERVKKLNQGGLRKTRRDFHPGLNHETGILGVFWVSGREYENQANRKTQQLRGKKLIRSANSLLGNTAEGSGEVSQLGGDADGPEIRTIYFNFLILGYYFKRETGFRGGGGVKKNSLGLGMHRERHDSGKGGRYGVKGY